MRARFVQTLVLPIIAVLLAGYYLLFESHDATQPQPLPAARDLFQNISPESVLRIEINSAQRTLVVLKDSGIWWLEHPRRVKANVDEVARLISILTTAKYQRKLSLSGVNRGLDEFGLQHPSTTVAITHLRSAGKGQATQVVHFGQQSPSGLQTYAIRPGERDLLLTDSEIVNQIKYFLFVPPVARSHEQGLASAAGKGEAEKVEGDRGD
ncbi:MAG: DUF4340 domain-containing protein [Candidatus Coatesbacteria bacterium]|nr:DUF4340 domain-containing protein [Candidatus Coatesbacteria bacterium]